MKRLGIALFVLSALLLTATPSALAEVCAVFVGDEFDHLDVQTDEQKGVIWARLSSRPAQFCLNVDGDLNADPMPTWAVILTPDMPVVREELFTHRTGRSGASIGPERPSEGSETPLVVWASDDGVDYELYYAFWDYETDGWSDPRWVYDIDNDADDTVPVLSLQGEEIDLIWQREGLPPTERMWSVGEVVSVGPTIDITWSDPEVVSVQDPAEDLSPSSTRSLGGLLESAIRP